MENNNFELDRYKIAAILKSITDGFIVIDRQWRCVYINKAGERLLQTEKSKCVGQDVRQVFPQAIQTIFYDEFRRCFTDNVVLDFEALYPPAKIWFEVRAYPSPDYISVYYQDITKRKRLEEALQRHEAQLRLITDALPAMISYVDAQERYQFINKGYVDFYTLPSTEILGKRVNEVVSPLTYATIEPKIRTVLGGNQVSYDIQVENKQGEHRDMKVTYIPDIYDKGYVRGFIALLQDITEQNHAQEKVRQANQELLHLNQLRSEFTSMVSHELRTPLTAIKEGIDIILEEIDGPITVRQKTTLSITKNNVDRLARLINDVLDFNKISSGRMQLYFEKVDLNQLVTEIYHFMNMAAKKQTLDFSVTLPEETIWALCDPDKIRQILINLIDNAIKYTDTPGQIFLTLVQLGHEIIVTVKDTGVGIKLSDQEKIFEMYGQSSDNGIRKKTGGTGVGLAICKKFIELHSGTITVTSKVGQGSAFTIQWPTHPPHI